jgi:hypothetical protein
MPRLSAPGWGSAPCWWAMAVAAAAKVENGLPGCRWLKPPCTLKTWAVRPPVAAGRISPMGPLVDVVKVEPDEMPNLLEGQPLFGERPSDPAFTHAEIFG